MTTKLCKLTMFKDDMGSYTTNCRGLDDALWDINSARDHDGLRHIDMDDLLRMIRNGDAKLTRIE